MNYLKSICLLLMVYFLTGCPPQPPSLIGNRDYDARKTADKDRGNVLTDSRRRYSGRTCEQEARDHQCKEDCRDIYSRRGDRDDCEELPVAQITELIKIHEIVEDPDEDDLNDDVEHEDFDVYLNVSIAPLDRHIGRYKSKDAKVFMKWMIENSDVAKVFQKEDDDYKTLKRLLKEIQDFSGNDQIHLPFIENLDGGDKLMEVVLDVGNEEILDWFQEYINEENSDCEEDETSEECFKVYCKIGDGINDDSADDWLEFETFENYINEIIGDKTNGSNWKPRSKISTSTDSYQDSRDLDDDWVQALCDDLKT